MILEAFFSYTNKRNRKRKRKTQFISNNHHDKNTLNKSINRNFSTGFQQANDRSDNIPFVDICQARNKHKRLSFHPFIRHLFRSLNRKQKRRKRKRERENFHETNVDACEIFRSCDTEILIILFKKKKMREKKKKNQREKLEYPPKN